MGQLYFGYIYNSNGEHGGSVSLMGLKECSKFIYYATRSKKVYRVKITDCDNEMIAITYPKSRCLDYLRFDCMELRSCLKNMISDVCEFEKLDFTLVDECNRLKSYSVLDFCDSYFNTELINSSVFSKLKLNKKNY